MVDSPKVTLSRCIVKLEEDAGEINVASDTQLGLSASCLFMPNETCEKFVELAWEFTQPVNLIDWIGLFHTDQPSHLHYMDFKSYGVCGSRKGSVNWKISRSNIVNNNVDDTSSRNPTPLCFRYYDGLTGVLRASSPPLFVYSDAQITVTSIVCKNIQASKNLAYYGKLCSGPCQYRTPYSSDGCWHDLNFSFPADRSSEIKLTLKERVHWAASGGRVLGVVNIAMCGLVGTNKQWVFIF
ncbi:E3 ubiquitin-protein ligase HECW1 [Ditylenchus destructor]|nr:E3 ubiquitin-protein ligase HECW1 [Ditylenchus destructor]